MFAMLAMAAAIAVVPPIAADARDWVTPADYPADTLHKRESGFVGFALLISSDGRNEKCFITYSSGDAELDQYTCRLVMARAVFRPAIDANGNKSSGVYQSVVSWFSGAAAGDSQRYLKDHQHPSPVDMEITVSRLPAGSKSKIYLNVGVEVGADGKLGFCGAAPSKWADLLGKIACEQVKERWTPPRLLDESGNGIARVQNVLINFNNN